ncbi:MAG: hypothetical protein SVG88_05880 [Halobacteriales archaeon]|nr:hypothetical protein [Halobacteriales archaeon]
MVQQEKLTGPLLEIVPRHILRISRTEVDVLKCGIISPNGSEHPIPMIDTELLGKKRFPVVRYVQLLYQIGNMRNGDATDEFEESDRQQVGNAADNMSSERIEFAAEDTTGRVLDLLTERMNSDLPFKSRNVLSSLFSVRPTYGE